MNSFYSYKERTKMAPAYANLFMGFIEPKLQSLADGHIHIWKRYIEDILIIWTGNHEQLRQTANSRKNKVTQN